MKYYRLLGLLLLCVFITSCQKDVSGTYKSIKTSETLGSDEISIDWQGRALKGLCMDTLTSYTPMSQKDHIGTQELNMTIGLM